MYGDDINFPMISKALSISVEALTNELQPSELALQKLEDAQRDFHQALSFSAAERVK